VLEYIFQNRKRRKATLIGPITKFFEKHSTYPRSIEVVLPFGPNFIIIIVLYTWKFKFGESIWGKKKKKVWCYWEHLGEHIGEFVLKTIKSLRQPKKKKKLGSPEWMLNLLKLFVTIFNQNEYPYITRRVVSTYWNQLYNNTIMIWTWQITQANFKEYSIINTHSILSKRFWMLLVTLQSG
jgi:hypothetical protein